LHNEISNTYSSIIEYDEKTDDYIITLPNEILSKLEIKEGQVFEFETDVKDNRIYMKKREKLTKSEMTEVLKNHVCVVSFEKVDGEFRKMRCTLMESYLPTIESSKGSPRIFPDNVIPVWDIDKGAWRSFRVDKVLTFYTLY
jgi:bifunctional DNA-binding transcriptional regulator/antitoxin component of YhaV-PrlF toxin-antitoxin module